MSAGPSLAWALGAQAVGYALETIPLPPGPSEAMVGKWRLVVNNSKLDAVHVAGDRDPLELRPFELYCEHTEFVSFGLLGPDGGIIGGYSEDRFIDDMVAALPADALLPFEELIETRKEIRS